MTLLCSTQQNAGERMRNTDVRCVETHKGGETEYTDRKQWEKVNSRLDGGGLAVFH